MLLLLLTRAFHKINTSNFFFFPAGTTNTLHQLLQILKQMHHQELDHNNLYNAG